MAIAGWPLLDSVALALETGPAYSEDFGPAPILTPPPDEVAGVKMPVAALGGRWRFAAAPPEAFFAQDFDDRSWKPIEVPGEWALQGFTVAKGTAAGYRRQFAVPADWAGPTASSKTSRSVSSFCALPALTPTTYATKPPATARSLYRPSRAIPFTRGCRPTALSPMCMGCVWRTCAR
jgi:hypothetical protein